MTKFDKDYLKLCKKILEEGEEVENRTGINTLSIGPAYLHFDQSEEFPILTTKQVFYRKAILEMLWIYQAQSNDVRWLLDREVEGIWDDWMVDADGIYRIYDPNEVPKNKEYHDNEVDVVDLDGKPILDKNCMPIKTSATEEMKQKRREITGAKYYGDDFAYTIGTAYGYIIKKYGALDKLIDNLKNNPQDRRGVISLWQNADLKTAVLPSCVWSSEWNVNKGKLNAWVHQRSCDVPAGLPFNITQYSVLQHMLAKEVNLEPGTLDWSINNAHIYVNQIDSIKEQIRRGEELPDLEAPELWLNPDKSFYEYNNTYNSKEPEKGYKEDIKILNYKHHGPIKVEVAR